MALPYPQTMNLRAVKWSLDAPGNLLASPYSGSGKVVANPWHAKWSAHAEVAPLQGEAAAAPLRAWLASLKGQVVPFRLNATTATQNSNRGVTVAADAAQGASSMTIDGADTALTDGQFVTVNGQLLCLTADQSGSTISFSPPLRQAAPAGTDLVTSRPYALVYMAQSRAGWGVGRHRMFSAAFDCVEAVRETDPDTVPETAVLLLEDGGFMLAEDAGLMLAE